MSPVTSRLLWCHVLIVMISLVRHHCRALVPGAVLLLVVYKLLNAGLAVHFSLMPAQDNACHTVCLTIYGSLSGSLTNACCLSLFCARCPLLDNAKKAALAVTWASAVLVKNAAIVCQWDRPIYCETVLLTNERVLLNVKRILLRCVDTIDTTVRISVSKYYYLAARRLLGGPMFYCCAFFYKSDVHPPNPRSGAQQK